MVIEISKSCCSTTAHRRSHFEVALEAIDASLWLHLVLGQVRLLLGSELTRSALVQIGLITTAYILPFVGGIIAQIQRTPTTSLFVWCDNVKGFRR